MLVAITSARLPNAPESGAIAGAETLAWFGTAYGRRVPKQNPLQTPERDVPAPASAGSAHRRRRPIAPLVVLGAVAIALVALRTHPVPPPPALAPAHEDAPVEPTPQIEASHPAASHPPQSGQPAPVVESSRQEAERLARDASDAAGALAAANLERQGHPAEPLAELLKDRPAVPVDTPATELGESKPATPPGADLPPPIPLAPAAAQMVEARLAPAPAPASSAGPEPVVVREGRIADGPPSPIVTANLPSPQRQTAPASLTHSQAHSGNPHLAAGQVHFAKGDLTAARASFNKAFALGLPEAALALGNTFDPVSLAKAGVKNKGDPEAARRWYRRAFELAMRPPARRGP